jgi:hypothetical protein
LDPRDQNEIKARLELEDGPSLPATLLADAKHLAWIVMPPQRRESLLLAAIACEVAIKTALREACPEPAKALLAYALDNPADVRQQAAGLFHVAARAITGRSYRDEDNEGWQAVRKLFEKRNRVAHYGEDISGEDLGVALNAASTAITWTRSLATP